MAELEGAVSTVITEMISRESSAALWLSSGGSLFTKPRYLLLLVLLPVALFNRLHLQ